MMKTLFRQIRLGNKVLFYIGLLHLVLGLVFSVLMGLDIREVNQESVWLKPPRFAFSIWLE